MPKNDADVVVIGAGAAGLAAARGLAGTGLTVVILEARDRIGGRIHTLRDPLSPLPIELGAEFVHGTPAETWEIIRSARLAVAEVNDTHWFLREGRLNPMDAFWEQMEQVFGRVRQVREPDLSFTQFLQRYCTDLTAPAIENALAFVERAGVVGVDARSRSSAQLAIGSLFARGIPLRLGQWVRDRICAERSTGF